MLLGFEASPDHRTLRRSVCRPVADRLATGWRQELTQRTTREQPRVRVLVPVALVLTLLLGVDRLRTRGVIPTVVGTLISCSPALRTVTFVCPAEAQRPRQGTGAGHLTSAARRRLALGPSSTPVCGVKHRAVAAPHAVGRSPRPLFCSCAAAIQACWPELRRAK